MRFLDFSFSFLKKDFFKEILLWFNNFWSFSLKILQNVHETIVKNKIFKRGEIVALGASGGKDSTVLAYIMKFLNTKHNYGLNLVLISIDEGIQVIKYTLIIYY